MQRARHMDSRVWARFGGLALIALAALGCESGGVGDPCIPDDELSPNFPGFAVEEVNIESRSYQCETRVCLVNKFQGRVSCPYGTNGTLREEGAPSTVNHNFLCEIPTLGGVVESAVEPQRTARSPEDAVYCSCRCAGADPNARYCECPSGFECAEIVPDRGQGQQELAGSYCVRSGTNVDLAAIPTPVCELAPAGQPPGPDEETCGNPPEPVAAAN